MNNFKSTYNSKLVQIPDVNTSNFWDKKFEDERGLYYQDGMTKERISTVYSYIPKNIKRFLDIGAGQGFIEELISKDMNIQIYANDFSKRSIQILKKKFKGDFKLQSIYQLKYNKNFFDVVCILEVLEHIPPPRVFKILKTINSYLKHRGVLVISVPMNEGLENFNDNQNGHVRDYTKEIIRTELEVSGFKVIQYKEIYAFNRFYSIKKIFSKVFRNRWKPNNIIIKAIKP